MYDESRFVCLLAANGKVRSDKVIQTQPEHWYIDSRASVHITLISTSFTSFDGIDSFPARMKDKINLIGTGRRYAELSMNADAKIKNCLLNNVLYVLALRYSLLSVGKLAKSNTAVISMNKTAKLLQKIKIVEIASKSCSRYA